ncbi:MAG: 30S ribosomal protein S15 [Candidatus Aenigmatarchaeota archaeon]
MSRMYSRKKGKSGSTKPLKKEAPWVKYKPKEIEDIVAKLAKKGYTSSKIGLVMRDEYGIPSVSTVSKGTKVAKIMKDHKIYPKMPEDMLSLLKKAVNLNGHMEKNKKDYTSKRGLEITESKIRRLAKYYKSKGEMEKTWKYDPMAAKLLVK